MAEVNQERRTGIRELAGIGVLTLSALMVLALVSYDAGDISILQAPPNDPPLNFIGPVGAWFSFLVLMMFGNGAWLTPLGCILLGLLLLFQPAERIGLRLLWIFVFLLALSGLLALHPSGWGRLDTRFNITGVTGGVVGWLIADRWLAGWLGQAGATILLIGLLVVGLTLCVGFQRMTAFGRILAEQSRSLRSRMVAVMTARRDRLEIIAREERDIARQIALKEKALRKGQRQVKDFPDESVESAAILTSPPIITPTDTEPPGEKSVLRVNAPEKAAGRTAKPPKPSLPQVDHYELPTISILKSIPATAERNIESDFQTTAKILQETLADFGVECEVVNYEQGPVVTQYQLKPAAGVRVERITQLSNNLALTLKATSVRVQAPIPGKGVVGIEVPNSSATKVYLREILEGKTWAAMRCAIPLVLGKDVAGNDLVADLAVMPHLLIAGATGSGKTVCMNSILAGMLMSRTPAQLKLMLVDPKRVEFANYANLPHLVTPVIVESKRVPLGLHWAINEMEARYKLFAKVGVRNIQGFNSRPVEQNLPVAEIAGEEEQENLVPDRIPYIVIVIDELSDLMLVAQADVENAIARLAQMSRAVGIHMILATQRPSVNVITGTIKANFPARISFQVAQKVDSRTILDTSGADKLLGRGDMLILPPGSSKLIRAQGAMTTDDDIYAIVEFWRKQGEPSYEMKLKASIESSKPALDLDDEGVDEDMLQSAIAIIRETQRASVSLLQRRLKIGYNRAGRLMDQLEDKGVVGPVHGSDPREILIDLDGEIPVNTPEQGGDV
ncbi:MAG: DNA translocase FtsK [Verrucomicrobia bacterium]|nr:DNA translocase FtsK [Verrucomicrobiota bacterium]